MSGRRHRREGSRRRNADLQRRIQDFSEEPIHFGRDECLTPEEEERFLRYILDFESAPQVNLFDVLGERGVALPAPEELEESRVRDALWKIIRALADLCVYLHSTDHLSDVELYTVLWKELLREPTVLLPGRSEFACHLDLVSGGSQDDIETYLKYYAGEPERRRWPDEFPGERLPPADPRPYDRDRCLPPWGCERESPSGESTQ